MESIPLPDVVFILWPASIAVIVVTGALVWWASSQETPGGLGGFLLPFAIPTLLCAIIAFLIGTFGSLLLFVGKTIAVPVALGAALLVLLGCAYLAARPERAAPPPPHRH